MTVTVHELVHWANAKQNKKVFSAWTLWIVLISEECSTVRPGQHVQRSCTQGSLMHFVLGRLIVSWYWILNCMNNPPWNLYFKSSMKYSCPICLGSGLLVNVCTDLHLTIISCICTHSTRWKYFCKVTQGTVP